MQRKLKNIYRVEIPVTKAAGWQVRTVIGGKDRSKYFGDKKFLGNPAYSLEAAIAYRDVAMDFITR